MTLHHIYDYRLRRRAERQETGNDEVGPGNGAGALLIQIGPLGRAVPDVFRLVT